MKVLKQSSTQLIIQHKPVFNWVAYFLGIVAWIAIAPVISRANPEIGFLGYVPSVISLLLIITTSRSNNMTTWNFNKSDDIFVVELRGFFRKQICTYPLSEIRCLKIDEIPGELLVKVELLLLHNSRERRLYLDGLISSVAKQEINRISSFLQD